MKIEQAKQLTEQALGQLIRELSAKLRKRCRSANRLKKNGPHFPDREREIPDRLHTLHYSFRSACFAVEKERLREKNGKTFVSTRAAIRFV